MLWDALQLRCIVDHLLHQFALVFKMYVSERLTQWHGAVANHARGTQTLPLASLLTPVIPLDLKSGSEQSTQADDVLSRDIESTEKALSCLSLDGHRGECGQKSSSKNSKVTPQESSAEKNRGNRLSIGSGGTSPISSKSAPSPCLQRTPSDTNVSSKVDIGSPQPNMFHSMESTNASNAVHRPKVGREAHASGSDGNTDENNLSEAENGPVMPGSRAVITSSSGDETSSRQTRKETHVSESNANTDAARLVRAQSSPCTQKSKVFTTGPNGGEPAERHQSGPTEDSESPKPRSLSSGRRTRSGAALGLSLTPSKGGLPAGRRLFESCPQPARTIATSPPLKPIESPSEKVTTRARHRLSTKAAGLQGSSGVMRLPDVSEISGPPSSPSGTGLIGSLTKSPGTGLAGSPSKPPGTGLFGSPSTPPMTYGLPSESVTSELFGGAPTSSSTSGSATSTQFRGFGSASSTQSFGFESGTSTQSAGLSSGASTRSSTSEFGTPQSVASRSSVIPVHRRSSSSKIPLPTSEILPGRSKSDTLPFHQPPEKPETSTHLNDNSETD
jgi:hypothetical protein